MPLDDAYPSSFEPKTTEKKEEGVAGAHPRQGLSEWKWKGALSVFALTSVISGELGTPFELFCP